jgi:RNA polymerase sigma-70 factor, ECF subfamily
MTQAEHIIRPRTFPSNQGNWIIARSGVSGRAVDQHRENALIAGRLRDRDPEILDELICRYHHRLHRYLACLTGSRELAEDLFQDTWIRVLLRGAQFKGDSQFSSWLFCIARNLAFDLRRRTPAISSIEELTEAGDERRLGVTKENSPFDYCAALEDARLVKIAISWLKPEQRELIFLRFKEDMSLKEISAVTGTSLSTVKSRLYRGLAMLKSRMTSITRLRQQSDSAAATIPPESGRYRSNVTWPVRGRLSRRASNAGCFNFDARDKQAQVLINGSSAGTVKQPSKITALSANATIELHDPGHRTLQEGIFAGSPG